MNTRDILAWVYKRQVKGTETSWSNFEKEFGPWNTRVRSKKCAKQTFISYKRQLEAVGKLRKRLSDKTGRPTYYIPEEFKREGELASKLSDLEHAAEQSVNMFDAKLQKMFEDASSKIVSGLLGQFKSWLIEKGYENLAKEMEQEKKLGKVNLVFKS